LVLFKLDRKKKHLHSEDKINLPSLLPDLDKKNLFLIISVVLRSGLERGRTRSNKTNALLKKKTVL
jgi:hypothetical protein